MIANGGMLVKPKLVLKRGDKLEPTEAPVRVLKPETVMTMRMMMEGVVLNPRGTAHRTARLDGYTSAGKTGTAQIFDSQTHHYTHYYNASFMGFTPVTNPQLVIVVTVNRTAGDAGMGAAAAGPVFKYRDRGPAYAGRSERHSREASPAAPKPSKNDIPAERDVSIADLGGTSVMEEDTSLKMLLAEQVKPVPDPDEIPAAPVPASSVASGPTVPDFRGKSMRDVVEQASADGIHVTLEGSGVARAQLPPPGSPLRRGERIRIVFAR